MRRGAKAWLIWYVEAPFRVLALILDIYQTNRDWLERRMARPKARDLYHGAVAVTVIAWLVIWLFADGDGGDRLSEAVRGLWQDSGEAAGPQSGESPNE